MIKLSRSRGAFFASELPKGSHVKRESGGGKWKPEGGTQFLYSLRRFRQSQDIKKANKIKDAERRQTLFNNLRILRCGSAPC